MPWSSSTEWSTHKRNHPPMPVRWIYITTPTPEEARNIGHALVKEGLAACVNILGGMESIYLWEDELQHDQETVLIAKTTAPLVDTLTARVKELHSYDVPCVLSLAAEPNEGNPDFLNWIRQAVRRDP